MTKSVNYSCNHVGHNPCANRHPRSLDSSQKTVKCREAWFYDIESTWRGMKEGLVVFNEYWNVGKLIKKILLVLRNYMG